MKIEKKKTVKMLMVAAILLVFFLFPFFRKIDELVLAEVGSNYVADTYADTSMIGSSNQATISGGQAKITLDLLADGQACPTDDRCWSAHCYRDIDGDQYAASSGDKVCKALVSLGVDCDDSTNTKWQNLTCYLDADGDSYTVAGGTSVCKGASCASPVSSYKALSSPVDCYDSNANAKPGQTAYYTVNRGDGSFDYNCSGATEKSSCNGFVACTLGGSAAAPYPACGGMASGYTTCSNGAAYEASCGAAWTSYAACSVIGQGYGVTKGPSCYVQYNYYGCSGTGYTCSCH
jgi:hypothetical protein